MAVLVRLVSNCSAIPISCHQFLLCFPCTLHSGWRSRTSWCGVYNFHL